MVSFGIKTNIFSEQFELLGNPKHEYKFTKQVARPVQQEQIEPAFQQLPAVPARVAPRPASPARLEPFRVDSARPEPLSNNNVLAQNLHAFPDTFTTFQA